MSKLARAYVCTCSLIAFDRYVREQGEYLTSGSEAF